MDGAGPPTKKKKYTPEQEAKRAARTPEQIQAAKDRMAKVRAAGIAKKAAEAASGIAPPGPPYSQDPQQDEEEDAPPPQSAPLAKAPRKPRAKKAPAQLLSQAPQASPAAATPRGGKGLMGSKKPPVPPAYYEDEDDGDNEDDLSALEDVVGSLVGKVLPGILRNAFR